MKKLIIVIISLITLSAFAQSGVDSLDQGALLETTTDSIANASIDVANPEIGNDGSPEAMFEAANQAFIAGQYPLAVARYEAILDKGVHSDKLYYNLGNAYFQQNQIGKAILNYSRAKNLAPFDDDIQYNLDLAKAKTKDKIEVMPQFFLVRWVGTLSGMLTSNVWAWGALAFFVLTALGTVLWLVSQKMGVRKVGFFVALFAMILTVSSIAFSVSASEDEYDSKEAVVINTAAPIKSSPSNGGKDIFILHEGTIVTVEQQLEGYSEISLADGNKGWIQSSAIEFLLR